MLVSRQRIEQADHHEGDAGAHQLERKADASEVEEAVAAELVDKGVGLVADRRDEVQAYRFIADTRDQAINERLDNLEDPYRLFRCHSIMNCVDVCPKGLNPTKAIGKIKDLLVERSV